MTYHCVFTIPIIKSIIISPTFDCIIITGRKQNVFWRMPFNIFYILRVSFQYSNTSVFIIFLRLPNPNCLISTACCEILPIITPWCTFYFIFMTFQLSKNIKFIIIHLPNANSSIETCTREYYSIRVPSNVSYSSRMSLIQYCLYFLLFRILQ